MADIPPELVERMVALVQTMSADNRRVFAREIEEARSIVALLPEASDPDLIEGREILARTFDALRFEGAADEARAGEYDRCTEMRAVLAALNRGRELAQPGK